MKKILIYGANGYTGRLIIVEALLKKLNITIAGRNELEIKDLAEKNKLDFEVFSLEETEKLNSVLQDHEIVIHCAGPFIHTALTMAKACLENKTHYLDITGEYQVFEQLHSIDQEAKNAGVMLLPGAGFDVVPSDCLSNYLKTKLDSATHLILAFTSTGGSLSRGTAKTMIEGAHEGQCYRSQGVIKTKELGNSTLMVNYGKFEQISAAISWGDISTSYFSTGIENIEVFTGSSKEQISKMKWMGRLKFVLKLNWVKSFLKKQIDKKPAGPSDQKREKGRMLLWGKVSNGKEEVEAHLITPNGYTLTAITAILIASKILDNNFKPGYQTPAMAYGHNLILEVEGTKLTE
jgi:short subunit dehydrogenase-like uncharacterized protein